MNQTSQSTSKLRFLRRIKMQNKMFKILNILFYFAVIFLSLNFESLRGTYIVFIYRGLNESDFSVNQQKSIPWKGPLTELEASPGTLSESPAPLKVSHLVQLCTRAVSRKQTLNDS